MFTEHVPSPKVSVSLWGHLRWPFGDSPTTEGKWLDRYGPLSFLINFKTHLTGSRAEVTDVIELVAPPSEREKSKMTLPESLLEALVHF